MVKIYTSKTCAQCPTVKKFMKHKGVEYEEIDVTDDPTKLVNETGLMSVPVTTREGMIPVLGYNPQLLTKIVS